MSEITTVLINTRQIVNSHTSETEDRYTLAQINKSMIPLFHFESLEEFLACICISEMGNNVLRELKLMSENGIYSPMCVAMPGFVKLMPVRGDLNIGHDIEIYLNLNGPEIKIQDKQYSRYETKICRSRQCGYQNHHVTDQHPLLIGESYVPHEVHVEILSYVWGFWDGVKESNQEFFRDDIVECIAHFAADQELFSNDDRQRDNYISIRAMQATDVAKSLRREAAIIGNAGINPSSLIDGPATQMKRELVNERFYNIGVSFGMCLESFTESAILRAWHASFSDRFTVNRSSQWDIRLQEMVKSATSHQQVEAHRLIAQLSKLGETY